MAEASEERISRKARDLFDKGRMAMERKNYSYAADMFLGVLGHEAAYAPARKFFLVASIGRFFEANPKPMAQKIAHVVSTLSSLGSFFKIKTLLKKGRALDALRQAEMLMAKDPLNFFFIRFMCQAAEAAQLPDAAVQTLEVVREYYPENIELLRWLAGLFRKQNRHKEAKECMELLVSIRPNDIQIERAYKDLLAEESMAQGGWDEAGKGGGFRRAIRDASEAAALEQEAKAAVSDDNMDMLIERTKAKIKQEPDNLNYRRSLANYYLQLERFDDAIDCLNEVLRVANVQDPQVEQTIINIRLKQFDYLIEQARQNGDEAGVKSRTQEKQEYHFQELRKRVERYPNDLQLRFDFGEILVARGELDQALAQFQISQRHAQRRVQSLYYIGVCFNAKGQHDMAIEQLQKAAEELTEMNPFKMSILYELAQTLEALGKSDEALAQYKEIYQVDINFRDVAARIDLAYKSKKNA